MTEKVIKKRILSIDILRGFVMVIMALDHVRDYFHLEANIDDPLNLDTTTPWLFFTRWITHLCAPTFVFLSGTSIYLQSLRKTDNQLSIFLIKRGLWLILVEITLVTFAWTFNPGFNLLILQVIWAIGISMVVIGVLKAIRASYSLIFFLGILIVATHNVLDYPESAEGFSPGFWWDLMHHGVFKIYPIIENHFLIMVYPFLPWTGVMMLGYAIGKLYEPSFEAKRRQNLLYYIGFGALIFFSIVRWSNVYGNPIPWAPQDRGFLYTFFSFIDVTKYPPSLLYLCITLGLSLILVALAEKLDNGLSKVMIVFGRTAFFYYIIHLYVIHFVATLFFFFRGNTLADALEYNKNIPFLFVAPGEGFGLFGTYIVWILIVAGLYPFCKQYDNYKSNHREKWWLSYL